MLASFHVYGRKGLLTGDRYVGGAMVFAQESIKRFFEDHGEKTLAEGAEKKGTLIFTGTLGALRCNVSRPFHPRYELSNRT